MKNRIITLIYVMLLSLPLVLIVVEKYQHYQKIEQYTKPLPAPKQYERTSVQWDTPKLVSNVWKISKQGQPDSYLLGTKHSGKIGAKVNPELAELVGKIDKVFLETPNNIPEEELLILTYSALLSDTPLKDKMGRTAFLAFQDKVAKLPKGAETAKQLNQYRPWSALVVGTMALQPQGMSREMGVESLVEQQRQVQNKGEGYLETPTEAMLYFSLLSDSLAISLINDWVNDDDLQNENELHEAYAKGDFEQVNQLIIKQLTLSQDTLLNPTEQQQVIDWFGYDLIIARNKNWLPKIKQEIQKQSNLFAVGTAHLMGSQGLISLLRDEGYTVTPEPKLLVWLENESEK